MGRGHSRAMGMNFSESNSHGVGFYPSCLAARRQAWSGQRARFN